MSAIQLINEDKQFVSHEEITDYFKTLSNTTEYHVVSVFGSQSSGKSTLLNALFNTKFDTMDAQRQRQQTTKGIWMSHTENVNSNLTQKSSIFCVDVEGTDGQERGEDKDFERKAALFALATSEVLIINMWEQQVGLYTGNNLALLKTVFEVNLSLFGAKQSKVTLMFVIRDFLGVTPLESLADTLKRELMKIWTSLTDKEFDFDLKFVGLPHKVLQAEKFATEVTSLGDTFVSGECFSEQTLPLDGWALYAENCWDMIEHNKDLDIPTQQILVARFRTDEIAAEAFDGFAAEFSQQLDLDKMLALKEQCLEAYDEQAGKYAKSVYLERREQLQEKLAVQLREAVRVKLAKLKNELGAKFVAELAGTGPFVERCALAKKVVCDEFDKQLELFNKLVTLGDESSEFEEEIAKIIDQQREKELAILVSKIEKRVPALLKDDVSYLLTHPDSQLWTNVMVKFHEVLETVLSKYKHNDHYDFQLGCDSEPTLKTIKQHAWTTLDALIHDTLKEDSVVSILRDRFEDKFRYNDDDTPRFWKDEQEITVQYRICRDHALEVLPVLSKVSIDGAEVEPEAELDEDRNFALVLGPIQQERVRGKFRKQSDVAYVEAKRSILASHTHIPLWIYGLIVVLGWNEFMAVLRNPLLVTLFLIFGVGFYFINRMGLWGPFISVTMATVNEVTKSGKTWLRDALGEGEIGHKRPVREKPIELDTLNSEGKKSE